MKTISIFILLIYWSIMIFAPVMSKDFKLSRAKVHNVKIVEQKPRSYYEDRPPLISKTAAVEKVFSSDESQQTKDVNSSTSKNLPLGTMESILLTCSLVI